MEKCKKTVLFVSLLLIFFFALAATSQAAVYRFDFDSDYVLGSGHTGNFYTQAGFTQVLPNHLYGGANWFGWSADLSPGRDRGAISGDPQSDLHRDLHFAATTQTFSVNLASGTYTVILHFCDKSYGHDNIEVKAEGSVVLPDVDVPAGNNAIIKSFSVTVTDGTLNLQFADRGGSDPNWIINGIEVVPLPGSVLLLGSGLVGLGLLGFRRRGKL